LISADKISDWAKGIAAKHDLGWLLRRLIKETCPKWTRVDMQDGSQIYLGGYDGIVDCEGYKSFVPVGHSVWEIAVRKDIGHKANLDYTSRSAEPEGQDKGSTAYVSVTARVWSNRDEWKQLKDTEDEWQSVFALDACSLENWLEDAPGACNDFTRRCLGFSLPDLRTGKAIWESYSAGAYYAGGVQISASFVIAGRDSKCTQLVEWLSTESRSDGDCLLVYGPSILEIVHFICAAAHLSDTQGGSNTGTLTSLLWAKTEDALSSLSTLVPGHVIVVSAPLMIDAGKLASRRDCRVIVMHECAEAPMLGVWGDPERTHRSIYIEPAYEAQWVDELRKLGMSPKDALQTCQKVGLDYARFCQLAPSLGIFGLGRDCQ